MIIPDWGPPEIAPTNRMLIVWGNGAIRMAIKDKQGLWRNVQGRQFPQPPKGWTILETPTAEEVKYETQHTITKWARETFGKAVDFSRMIDRAREEFDELDLAVQQKKPVERLAMEMADVLIVLYNAASIISIDLAAGVRKKMVINRLRKWKSRGDGTGQHLD